MLHFNLKRNVSVSLSHHLYPSEQLKGLKTNFLVKSDPKRAKKQNYIPQNALVVSQKLVVDSFFNPEYEMGLLVRYMEYTNQSFSKFYDFGAVKKG